MSNAKTALRSQRTTASVCMIYGVPMPRFAVKAGMPIGVVSERLGHASPEFTLHRYPHVMPGMQREAADKIARTVRWGGAA